MSGKSFANISALRATNIGEKENQRCQKEYQIISKSISVQSVIELVRTMVNGVCIVGTRESLSLSNINNSGK